MMFILSCLKFIQLEFNANKYHKSIFIATNIKLEGVTDINLDEKHLNLNPKSCKVDILKWQLQLNLLKRIET